MTFLNPLVLIALVSAGIPLIIHLINLRKPRRVDFSSLAFLQELRQQTIRRLRIKQWLLLALRTLAIVCLVLAFARPTVESPAIVALSSDNRSVAAVFDNSLSMNLRDQGGSFFAQATDFVSGLASGLETSDELAVVPLVDDGLRHPLVRPSLVAPHLAEMGASYGRGSVVTALENAAAVLADGQNQIKEIYLVTDLQRANFLDSTGVTLEDDERVIIVPIGTRTVDNIAVTEVRVASSIVEVDQPTAIDVRVQNFGTVPVNAWGLSVYLEDERVAQSSITLESGEGGVVSIVVTPRTRGWLKGRVVLEDDGFEYDNVRFFTLHVPEERRILVVRGQRRNSGFLELALSSELSSQKRLFRVDRVNEGAVSGTFSSDYDAVILSGVRRMTTGLAAATEAFVKEGGGVLVFAGEEAAEGEYSDLLKMLGAGSFGGLAAAEPGATLATLDRVDREHPLFRSIFEEQSTHAAVEQPAISKIVRYRAGDGDEQTLLSTTIGLPMLQEVRVAPGRLLIAPFVPEVDWTDLPVRGLFVPLLVRSMYYLTSTDEEQGQGLLSGLTSTRRVNVRGPATRIRIVSDTGQEWIPEQRMAANGAFLSIPPTLRAPGIYDVLADDTLAQRFAINVDPLESDLSVFEPSDAVDRLEELVDGDVSVLNLASEDVPLAESIRRRQSGVEIWNVFLTLALLFLVAEMLVAARWKPAGSVSISA